MPRPAEIAASRQLIVEGKDDWLFFSALLHEIGRRDNVQIQDFGGVNDLGAFLQAFCRMSGFQEVSSIGVVRDAETSPKSAFQSVCSALEKAALPVPDAPLSLAQGPPNVAVLVLPDSDTPGMLEDLCLRTVAEDPAMHCVTEFAHCVESLSTDPVDMKPKALVQAFLASRPNPGLLLGQAAAKGYWPWDSEEFAHVRDFLSLL